jgi:ankyrin repeat protein
MVDFNTKDDWYRRTTLSWVVLGEQAAVVRLLLDTSKVKVNAKDKYGQTTLSWATVRGYAVVVKLLLGTGKVDPDVKDELDRTPLLCAAQGGRRQVATGHGQG